VSRWLFPWAIVAVLLVLRHGGRAVVVVEERNSTDLHFFVLPRKGETKRRKSRIHLGGQQ
jgi:hypothetical protein